MQLTDETRVAASEDAVARAVNGEAVILNLATSEYYVLNENSASMWSTLTSAGSFGAALRHIEEEFEVDPEVLRTDLEKFVGDLVSVGLLVLTDV